MAISIFIVIYATNLISNRNDIEFTYEISKVTIADNDIQELKLIDIFKSKSDIKRIESSNNISAELFKNDVLIVYSINQLEMKGENIHKATYYACIEVNKSCYISEIDSVIEFQNIIDDKESQETLLDYILRQESIMVLSSSLYDYLEQ